MTQEKEAFLDRWSRLKKEQPVEPPAVPEAKKEEAAAPPLQPVAELTPESDFTPFMNAKVDPATRRDALKKLFSDAHYNIPDPFEAYSEDYTQSEPIPLEMLKAINRVRDVAVKGPEAVAEEERLAAEAEQAERVEQAELTEKNEQPKLPTQEPNDVAGKQDA